MGKWIEIGAVVLVAFIVIRIASNYLNSSTSSMNVNPPTVSPYATWRPNGRYRYGLGWYGRGR